MLHELELIGLLDEGECMNVPTDPPIFHITHVDNLPGILQGREASGATVSASHGSLGTRTLGTLTSSSVACCER